MNIQNQENPFFIQLIQACQPAERKKFKVYLRSPIFSRSKQLSLLYHEILSYSAKNFEGINWQKVYKKLFPEMDFKQANLNTLLSRLTKHLEDFFALEALDKNEGFKVFLSALHKQQLGFPQQLINDYQKLSKHKNFDALPDLFKFYTLLSVNENKIEHRRIDDKHMLTKALDQLDLFYIKRKLQLIADFSYHSRIKNVPYTITLEKEILDTAKSLVNHHPEIAIYYQVIHIYQETFEFNAVKKVFHFFQSHLEDLPRPTQQQMIIHLTNLSFQFIGKFPSEGNQLLFEIFKIGAAKNLLLKGNKIREVQFLNAVIIASNFQEYEWAWKFIEQYKGHLPGSSNRKAQMYNLALAHYYFYKEAYEAVIPLLRSNDYLQVGHRRRGQFLYIRALFDWYLRDREYPYLLAAQQRAKELQKIYLKEHQEGSKTVIASLNTMNIILEMLDVLNQKDNSIAKIARQIETTDLIIAKEWLNRKVKYISNNFDALRGDLN